MNLESLSNCQKYQFDSLGGSSCFHGMGLTICAAKSIFRGSDRPSRGQACPVAGQFDFSAGWTDFQISQLELICLANASLDDHFAGPRDSNKISDPLLIHNTTR